MGMLIGLLKKVLGELMKQSDDRLGREALELAGIIIRRLPLSGADLVAYLLRTIRREGTRRREDLLSGIIDLSEQTDTAIMLAAETICEGIVRGQRNELELLEKIIGVYLHLNSQFVASHRR